jgi:WD40 repeat protein/predicted Ser/Thr protein kinase
MSTSGDNTREAKLNEILAGYLQARQRGETPDRQALAAQHPEYAADLASFFADQDRFQKAAGPLKFAAGMEEATLGPADSALSTGQHVRYFGDYEVIEEIARGGMGVVYRARQVNLKRIVALKMVLAGQLATPQEIQRFYAEAEAAAKLAHPNIVPIFEVGQHEQQHYFSMAFVDGDSLAHRIAQGVLEPREAARLMKDVTSAIAYAHVEGVIHRDLKPGNILIDKDGTPRVTDFGLAKRVEGEASGLTVTGQILGTPSYMPPEQASGDSENITQLSDVYSLGAVLYCLVTGRPPFQAASPVDTLLQVLMQEPVSPRQLNAAVPLDLETIILKCLEKAPARRYESATALAEELDRWLRGEPILARPVGRTERMWRWCKRNPAVASLLAAVAASLMMGAIVATFFAFRAEENARRALANEKQALTNRDRALDQEKLARIEQQAAEQARSRAQWLSYAGQIALAHREWQDGDCGHARELLDTCQWNQRGWEHDLLYTLFNDRQQTYRGHASAVLCVAFSPNGQRIAASGGNPFNQAPGDWRVRVWDVLTGEQVLVLAGHNGDVDSLSFSPDGSLLASGGYQVKIWDAQTGAEKMTLGDAMSPALFSPDGKQILTCGPSGEIRIWNAVSGAAVATIPRGTTRNIGRSLAWSADSTRVLVNCNDESLKVFNVQSGESVLDLEQSGNHHPTVAFSPDDHWIAGVGHDNSISLWDAKTGKQLRRLPGHREYVSSLAFSPDSRRLCSGSYDKLLTIWDVSTGNAIRTLKGHAAGVVSVAFNGDGSQIVSGSHDETVKVWNAEADQGPLTTDDENGGGLRSVAVSPSGDHIAAASWYEDAVRIVDSRTGQEVRTLKGGAHPVAYSRGNFIVTGGDKNTLIVWDAATGEAMLTLPAQADEINCVAISPDGLRFVTGSRDTSAVLWDARTGHELSRLTGHRSAVLCVAFSPNGEEIVTGGFDDILKVWDGITGKERLTLKGHIGGGGGVISAAYSHDGRRIVSGSIDHTVRIWDSKTGREIRTLVGHTSTVDAVAFIPNTGQIVSGGFDKTLRIWDAETGQTTMILKGHVKPIHALVFAPDGRLLVSGGKSLKMWDARARQLSRSIKAHALSVGPLVFSPDGRWLASGGWHDRTAKVWDTRTGQEHVSLNGGGQPTAFSPDSQQILTDTGDGVLKLWDARNGQELQTIHDCVGPAVFSTDGQHVTSGATDKSLNVWQAHSGQITHTYPGPTGVDHILAISPDGRRVVRSDDKLVKLWDATTGQETLLFSGPAFAAFNSDGRQFVAGHSSLKVWDAVTGKELRTLKKEGGAINSLAYGPNGRWIAVARERRIEILDGETGETVRTIDEHASIVTSLAFSPDSRSLASGSYDGMLMFWTIEP